MTDSDLTEDIIAARKAIVRRFEKFSQSVDGGQAWGFSLDPSNARGQVGIYGTVAAVDVLLKAGYTQNSDRVVGGLNALNSYFPDKNRRWHKKLDLDTTLKRAWMAKLNDKNESSKAHREWLVRKQLPNMGWGEFSADDYQSDSPDFVSTCFALIGLADYAPYQSQKQAAAAVRWLLSQVSDVKHQEIGELALATVALTEFSHNDKALHEETGRFVDRAAKRLRAFVNRRRPERTPFFLNYIHFIGNPPDARREIFQIPVELVALRALLGTRNSANTAACRKSLRRLVSSIIQNKGVFIEEKFRTETQYWAALVLYSLDDESIALLSKRSYRWFWFGLALIVILAAHAANVVIAQDPEVAAEVPYALRMALALAEHPLGLVTQILIGIGLAVWSARR